MAATVSGPAHRRTPDDDPGTDQGESRSGQLDESGVVGGVARGVLQPLGEAVDHEVHAGVSDDHPQVGAGERTVAHQHAQVDERRIDT